MMRGRFLRRQEGVSTVAFALMAPIILYLLFGVMEAGRVFEAWLVITNEAREAARYGSVNYGLTDSATLNQAVLSYLDGRLAMSLAPSGIYRQPVVNTSGGTVDVTVYYQVPLVIPLIKTVFPNPFPLAAHSVMRGE
jgi:Flp pilus assembly protein TadG